MNDCNSVGSNDLFECCSDGLHEELLSWFAFGLVKRFADEMGEHFGVGLGIEMVALLLKLGSERGVILNDAVMNHGEVPGLVEMGVGIFVGDPSMGGPAGV